MNNWQTIAHAQGAELKEQGRFMDEMANYYIPNAFRMGLIIGGSVVAMIVIIVAGVLIIFAGR